MRRFIGGLVGGAIAAAWPSAAATGDEFGDRRLAAMTPAAFAAKVDILDDSLETTATLTTRRGYQPRGSLLGLTPSDVFLRAFVSKTTGRAVYQVYVIAHYYGLIWADFSDVNYATPAGAQAMRLIRMMRVRTPCRYGRHCAQSETVAFPVDARLLRDKATGYVPGEVSPWPFKIKAHTGVDQVLFVSAAEIAGLMMAVDAYRADHHLQGG